MQKIFQKQSFRDLFEKIKISKRGQLGIIEFKYFMVGLIIGVILALVLAYLGSAGVIPFKIPLICGPAAPTP